MPIKFINIIEYSQIYYIQGTLMPTKLNNLTKYITKLANIYSLLSTAQIKKFAQSQVNPRQDLVEHLQAVSAVTSARITTNLDTTLKSKGLDQLAIKFLNVLNIIDECLNSLSTANPAYDELKRLADDEHSLLDVTSYERLFNDALFSSIKSGVISSLNKIKNDIKNLLDDEEKEGLIDDPERPSNSNTEIKSKLDSLEKDLDYKQLLQRQTIHYESEGGDDEEGGDEYAEFVRGEFGRYEISSGNQSPARDMLIKGRGTSMAGKGSIGPVKSIENYRDGVSVSEKTTTTPKGIGPRRQPRKSERLSMEEKINFATSAVHAAKSSYDRDAAQKYLNALNEQLDFINNKLIPAAQLKEALEETLLEFFSQESSFITSEEGKEELSKLISANPNATTITKEVAKLEQLINPTEAQKQILSLIENNKQLWKDAISSAEARDRPQGAQEKFQELRNQFVAVCYKARNASQIATLNAKTQLNDPNNLKDFLGEEEFKKFENLIETYRRMIRATFKREKETDKKVRGKTRNLFNSQFITLFDSLNSLTFPIESNKEERRNTFIKEINSTLALIPKMEEETQKIEEAQREKDKVIRESNKLEFENLNLKYFDANNQPTDEVKTISKDDANTLIGFYIKSLIASNASGARSKADQIIKSIKENTSAIERLKEEQFNEIRTQILTLSIINSKTIKDKINKLEPNDKYKKIIEILSEQYPSTDTYAIGAMPQVINVVKKLIETKAINFIDKNTTLFKEFIAFQEIGNLLSSVRDEADDKPSKWKAIREELLKFWAQTGREMSGGLRAPEYILLRNKIDALSNLEPLKPQETQLNRPRQVIPSQVIPIKSTIGPERPQPINESDIVSGVITALQKNIRAAQTKEDRINILSEYRKMFEDKNINGTTITNTAQLNRLKIVLDIYSRSLA